MTKLKRLGNPLLRIAAIALLAVYCGCRPVAEAGKPINFPKKDDVVLFGVRSSAASTMTNRYGTPINGLVLLEASLIRNAGELADSKHQQYVIFWGFLLGNGAR